MYILNLYGLCIKLGYKITSDYNVGIFIYTLIQCLASCLTFSFVIFYMAKRNIDIRYRVLSLIFFMIFPIFGFYSVWLTKDILFSLCITMTTIGIIELIYNKEAVKTKKYFVYMVLSLLLTMLFRKNGVYIVCLLALVCIIKNRKYWIQTLLIFLVPIMIFKLIDGPIRNRMGIENGSSVEMFSIPAQQMARIYKYDKDKLSEEQIRKIEAYILDKNIDQIYDPVLSDPVKAKLNEEKINNDKLGFLKFFIQLSFQFPNRTFESFTCTTYKFYYLDNEVVRGIDKYKEQSVFVIDTMLPKEMNVQSDVNDIKYLECMNEKIYEKDIPILTTLMGSGFYINMCIICIGYLIYRKKYSYIIGFLPVIFTILTQLAGPVVDQRYSYALFATFPLLLGISIYMEEK